MPVVSLTIPDVEQAIVRPALIDIIQQLQEIVRIGKDTHIFFPGDIKSNPTSQSSIDHQNDRRALFSNDQYLFIEVENDYNEDALTTTAVHQKEHIPFFKDTDINMALWPIYLTTDYTIQFRYRTPSKNEAIRWRDDIRTRISQMRDIFLHDITYHYTLPEEIWGLIVEIYQHKVRLQQDPPSLMQYIRQHSTQRLTVIGDMTNKHQDIAIAEKQCRIVGLFDFSSMSEKIEREDDNGSWICSFSYKLKFEKPALIGCRYPIMVYNQILPAQYVTFNTQQNEDEWRKQQNAPTSIDALSLFESQKQLDYRMNLYVPYRIPEFDEMSVKIGPPGYGTYLSVLTEVDESDRRSLFNLTDLDPYALDEDILDFIRTSEYPHITNAYHSILYIGLYENYQFKGNRGIHCDRDLNLKTVIDLDLRNIHHVLFSLLVDLPYLRPEAVQRLKNHPRAFVKIVQCINETLRDDPGLAILAKKPKITDADFMRLFRYVVNVDHRYPVGPMDMFQTPTNMDALTRLPVQTRQQNPTMRDSRVENDIIPYPYRGYRFEELRGSFMGFNLQQISQIIAIKV